MLEAVSETYDSQSLIDESEAPAVQGWMQTADDCETGRRLRDKGPHTGILELRPADIDMSKQRPCR